MTRKKFSLLLLLQMILAAIVMLISIYSVVTENFTLQPLAFLLMSGMIIIMGLREYKRTQSLRWGIVYLCSSLFVLYVAVQGFIYN